MPAAPLRRQLYALPKSLPDKGLVRAVYDESPVLHVLLDDLQARRRSAAPDSRPVYDLAMRLRRLSGRLPL